MTDDLIARAKAALEGEDAYEMAQDLCDLVPELIAALASVQEAYETQIRLSMESNDRAADAVIRAEKAEAALARVEEYAMENFEMEFATGIWQALADPDLTRMEQDHG